MQEIEIIIAIFYKYNLNTTKHMDFLSLAQAYILYSNGNKRDYRLKLKPTILSLKGSMNSKRNNFDPLHLINIRVFLLVIRL